MLETKQNLNLFPFNRYTFTTGRNKQTGSYAGRVEINLAGLWGTLHHDAVDFRAADVLCRMAGYSRGAVTIYTNARFGRGAGVTWLTQTKCTGRETSILDCPGLQWSRNQRAYFHGQDASIECRRPGVSYNGNLRLQSIMAPLVADILVN